jgi:hypothetical protein
LAFKASRPASRSCQLHYKHLSQIERYQIHRLMRAGLNITQIADLLSRSKSTIGRELRRNTGSRGYLPKQAPERAPIAHRRSQASRSLGVRHRHRCKPQAGHRDGGGAQERICGHGEGFKQDIRLGERSNHQGAQALRSQGQNSDLRQRKRVLRPCGNRPSVGQHGVLRQTLCKLGARVQRELQRTAAAICSQEATDGRYHRRGN